MIFFIKVHCLSDADAKSHQLVFQTLGKAPQKMLQQDKLCILHLISWYRLYQTSLGINYGIAHVAGARLHIPHGRVDGIYYLV